MNESLISFLSMNVEKYICCVQCMATCYCSVADIFFLFSDYSACASWQLKKKIAKLRRRLCVLKSNIRTSLVDDEQKLASDTSETAVEKQSDADDG